MLVAACQMRARDCNGRDAAAVALCGPMRLSVRNPFVRRGVSIAPGVRVTFGRGRKPGKPTVQRGGRFILWVAAVTLIVCWFAVK